MLQLENVICQFQWGRGCWAPPLICQGPPAPPGLFKLCKELNFVINSILMHGNVTVGKFYLSLPMGEGRLGTPLLCITFPLEKMLFNCTFLCICLYISFQLVIFHWKNVKFTKKRAKLLISVQLVFFHWKNLKLTFPLEKRTKTLYLC